MTDRLAGLDSCISCNRAPMRRSSGSKRRAPPVPHYRSFTSGSPPPTPTPLRAQPNAPPWNSPKPGG
jgi:hypothetical protein